MKKNMLKKTLAAVSAVSIAAISMVAFSVSAAGTRTIDIADVEAQPGETVVLDVTVSGNDAGIKGFKGAVTLGDGLTFVKTKASDFDSAMGSADGQNVGVACSSGTDIKGDAVMFTITVTVPEDAEPGTVYEINWMANDAANFYVSSTDDGMITEDAGLTATAGSITIPGAETTTEAPETTEAPATTTAAPAATTVAATTTAKATTVATTPKTGSTGIVATAAVLVAAAGAAVVVSKKRK